MLTSTRQPTAGTRDDKPPADGSPTPPGGPAPADPPANRSRPTRSTCRSLAGPLLLFALLGAFYTLPPQGGDRAYHLSGIIETHRALAEGQFPARVSPNFIEGRRYPIFQFYGNFPYTAAALLSFVPGINVYEGWKLVTFLSVTAAGFYTFRCTLVLTRQVWPSVVAGAVFVAAPYLATDVRARFAYTEAVSMCLLPAVLYYSLRAFTVRRGWGVVLKGGVAWSLVALSHNITYLYASALVCLFFLTLVGLDLRKYVRRMLRVGACYGVGLVLSLWYVTPQLSALRYISIAASNQAVSPLWSTTWAPLDVLLSPVLKIAPTAQSTQYFGVQVGWTILAGALLALVHVLNVARRNPRRRMLVALLFAAALSFFIVWSPVDFWAYVPSIFYNVQITYRILMFVVLWGSVLSGVALAATFRRGKMPRGVALACLLVIGIAAMPHTKWGRPRLRGIDLAQLIARPDFGPGVGMYLPLPEKLPDHKLAVPPGVRFTPHAEARPKVRYGRATGYRTTLAERTVVQLPILFYPGLQSVRDGGRAIDVSGHIDGLLALDLPPGEHRIRVKFVGRRWANSISGAAWLAVLAVPAVQFLRRRRSRPWTGPTWWGQRPGNPILPLRVAAAGFALVSVPMALSAGYERWSNYAARRALGKLTVSSEATPELHAFAAFDKDAQTAWAAGGSSPAWLVLEPREPLTVSKVVLEPRQTSLLEGWHKVGVILYFGSSKVAEQSFSLPDGGRQPVQELLLDAPARADRIELRFAEPITLVLDGSGHVSPSACNPGYREIRFD